MPLLARGGSGKGNQYVHFNVVIPTKVNERMRTLMEEFGKEENAASTSDTKGMVDRLKEFLKSSTKSKD
jgi:DnaJ-class molecular chaperone